MAQMKLQSGSHISLMSCTFDGVKHVSQGWEYAWQWYADLFIVKLGIVSSIYGDFGEESGWRCTYAHFSPDWDL